MQKWEYLFVEVVAEAEGTFHYPLNGVDQQTDTLEWKNGKFLTTWDSKNGSFVGALLFIDMYKRMNYVAPEVPSFLP